MVFLDVSFTHGFSREMSFFFKNLSFGKTLRFFSFAPRWDSFMEILHTHA